MVPFIEYSVRQKLVSVVASQDSGGSLVDGWGGSRGLLGDLGVSYSDQGAIYRCVCKYSSSCTLRMCAIF